MKYLIGLLLFVFTLVANAGNVVMGNNGKLYIAGSESPAIACDLSKITVTSEAQKHEEWKTAILNCDGRVVPFASMKHSRFVGPFIIESVENIEGVVLKNNIVDVTVVDEPLQRTLSLSFIFWVAGCMYLIPICVVLAPNRDEHTSDGPVFRWASLFILICFVISIIALQEFFPLVTLGLVFAAFALLGCLFSAIGEKSSLSATLFFLCFVFLFAVFPFAYFAS